MAEWTQKLIQSQRGKLAIVTGGTSGIGLEAARELARQGADVIIAGDRAERGEHAVDDILESAPGASIRFERLDTADLRSVDAFATRLVSEGRPIDILINNAGVTGTNERKLSPQAFEWCFAANYLGHFALTSQLFTLLPRAPGARVVNVASLAHASAKIHFGDLQLERGYTSQKAYGQSKLAMLLFARELARRARAEGLALQANPVHPGGVRTSIFEHARELSHASPLFYLTRATAMAIAVFGQSPHQGAWPLLYAATEPAAKNGQYYGPDGIGEFRGNPAPAKVHSQGLDEAAAERLWRISERLTGARFELAPLQVIRTNVETELRPAPQV